MLGKIEAGGEGDSKDDYMVEKEKGTTEIVRSHHQLDGHEFEQAPGVGDGHGSLGCYSPWGPKELDTAE